MSDSSQPGGVIVDKYITWCQIKGHRPQTIAGRVKVLRQYESEFGSMAKATDETLLEFLEGTTGWTRSTYARNLKSLLTYCVEAGLMDALPTVPRVKSPEPRPKPVSDAELALLIETAPNARMTAWFLLAAYAGLRAGEIAATGPKYLNGTILELPYMKGGGSGRVRLADWVADELRECPPWTISAGSLSQVTARHMTAQGVKPGIHRLRHWHGTTLLRQTHDMRLVQRALRHKSITSTVIYTLVDYEELAAAVQAINRVA